MSGDDIDNAHFQYKPSYFRENECIKKKLHCPICDVNLEVTMFATWDAYRTPTGGYEVTFYHRDSPDDPSVTISIEYHFRDKQREKWSLESDQRQQLERKKK